MKVILLSDIKGVGKKDQVIEASDGYARNFLFPKKLAVEANSTNMNNLKAKQESNQYRKRRRKARGSKNSRKIKRNNAKSKSKSWRKWKNIWWSNKQRNCRRSKKKDYNIVIDKKKIMLADTVKTLGTITVDIKLYEGVTGKLKVDIIAD